MSGIAVVFSGQGQQYLGMGQSFYEVCPIVRDFFAQAESITGMELKRLCFEGPMAELTETANLQPAITTVDMACFIVLREKGIIPTVVAGHSLGEITALFASGCLSLKQALSFVKMRGQVMSREAKANPGVMRTVIGLDTATVRKVCNQVDGVVQAANLNTPIQTVITGEETAVNEAVRILKEKKARIVPLKVSGPWHSPFMQKAEDELRPILEAMEFAVPSCFMVPNVSGRPTKDLQVIKSELMRQIVQPTNWLDTARNIWSMGIHTFVQAGPKNALVDMISQTIEHEVPETQQRTGLLATNVEDMETLGKALVLLKKGIP